MKKKKESHFILCERAMAKNGNVYAADINFLKSAASNYSSVEPKESLKEWIFKQGLFHR